MTIDEIALQNGLDENPSNHFLRLLLSEHLQEVGDDRWRGYRFLGHWQIAPLGVDDPAYRCLYGSLVPNIDQYGCGLPEDLFQTLWTVEGKKMTNSWWPTPPKTNQRRICEDLVALAFAQLPQHRQNELLALNLEAV